MKKVIDLARMLAQPGGLDAEFRATEIALNRDPAAVLLPRVP
jgi:hypothetical protein